MTDAAGDDGVAAAASPAGGTVGDREELPEDRAATTDRPAGGSGSADGESALVDVDHAPPRLLQVTAAGSAGLATALTAPFVVLAAPFGLAGLGITLAALFSSCSRRWLSAGVGLIFVGALVAGAYGAVPPELLLCGVGAAVLAWDAGQHAFLVGAQLGRTTRSRRLQVVHLAGTVLAVGGVSLTAYAVFLVGSAGRPGPAVALAVIGIVGTVWLYRR